MADARAFLDKLGIDRRSKLEEVSRGGRDARGRPYTKWRARCGAAQVSVRREDVADVHQALQVLAEERERILAKIAPEERELLVGGIRGPK